MWSWVFGRFNVGSQIHQSLVKVPRTVRVNEFFHHSLKNLPIFRVTDIVVTFKKPSHHAHHVAIHSWFRQTKSNTCNSSRRVRSNSFQRKNVLVVGWKLPAKSRHDILCSCLHIADTRIIPQSFPSLQELSFRSVCQTFNGGKPI